MNKVSLKRHFMNKHLAHHGLTQRSLAQSCGLNEAHMSQILSGKRHPRPATRQKILDVLRGQDSSITFDDLFEIWQ